MAKKSEVAEVEAGLPVGIDFAADAGAGSENVGAEDTATPFLSILQKMSPQCDEDDDAFIDGAKPGMYYNSVTSEMIDTSQDPLLVIPCHYDREYVEWRPRKQGGGIAERHSMTSGIMEKATMVEDDNGNLKPTLPNGNVLIDTAYHYCLIQEIGTGIWAPIIIPMKSTAHTPSRKFNNAILKTQVKDANGFMVQAPRWSSVYEFKTIRETKDTNSWYNFNISRQGWVTDAETYNMGKEFYNLISSGQIEKKESAPSAPAEPILDDEIPL